MRKPGIVALLIAGAVLSAKIPPGQLKKMARDDDGRRGHKDERGRGHGHGHGHHKKDR